MIKVLVLDLDGTILEGKKRHYQCYSDILLENGYQPMLLNQYWEMKRSRCDRRQQLAVSGAKKIYDFFLAVWLARIEEKKYLSLDYLQSGARAKIKNWQASGIKLILATMRNNEANLYWQLESLNLLPFFEQIVVVGTTDGINKKAKGVGQYIKRVDVSSVLWIGDTEADILAARQLGVKVGVVGSGLRVADYLLSLKPDLFFNNFQSIVF